MSRKEKFSVKEQPQAQAQAEAEEDTKNMEKYRSEYLSKIVKLSEIITPFVNQLGAFQNEFIQREFSKDPLALTFMTILGDLRTRTDALTGKLTGSRVLMENERQFMSSIQEMRPFVPR
jgi:hypothetical protein